MDASREINRFWFGASPAAVESLRALGKLWFGIGASSEERIAIDELIRSRFGEAIERAATGRLTTWADSPHRRLSLILLLDQFPRHVYRGTARAFATDREALALTLTGIQAAADVTLSPVERIFFYMPLQHAELPEAQEESLAAYRRLLAEAPAALRPLFASSLEAAERHHDVVTRFGRFPHRNQVLGRPSTSVEQAYLARGGQRFDR